MVADHPRIRGEHQTAPVDGHLPHGIIPAYAGSTAIGFSPSMARTDHPRIRGEHVHVIEQTPSWNGIIPAYAGSTRKQSP